MFLEIKLVTSTFREVELVTSTFVEVKLVTSTFVEVELVTSTSGALKRFAPVWSNGASFLLLDFRWPFGFQPFLSTFFVQIEPILPPMLRKRRTGFDSFILLVDLFRLNGTNFGCVSKICKSNYKM